MLEGIFSILIYALIIGLMVSLVLEIVRPFRGAISSRRFLSRDAGDRLRKYLVNCAKLNPRNCRVLKMRRTKYNNGGKIGKIVGVVPSKFVTRFIIKRRAFSGKQILYCPVDMHTNILCQDVIVNALGLENAAGFYYPHPYDKTLKKKVYNFLQTAFDIDMHSMFIMDMKMINPTQVEMAIAGERPIERIIREVPEEYEEVIEQ